MSVKLIEFCDDIIELVSQNTIINILLRVLKGVSDIGHLGDRLRLVKIVVTMGIAAVVAIFAQATLVVFAFDGFIIGVKLFLCLADFGLLWKDYVIDHGLINSHLRLFVIRLGRGRSGTFISGGTPPPFPKIYTVLFCISDCSEFSFIFLIMDKMSRNAHENLKRIDDELE